MPISGPSFLVHQGQQGQNVVPGFLDVITNTEPGWAVGASVFLPRYTPTTAASIASGFDLRAAYVIADPETWRLEFPFEERGRGRNHYVYLQESDPIANRHRFTRGVVDAQLEAGRDLIVTPWLTHGTDAVGRHLRATMRFATEAIGLIESNGGHALIGVAATEAVFSEPEVRHDFLDELVELPPKPIYLRFLVTPPGSFTQYRNDIVIQGIAEFIEALALNDRPVLLPQAGLVGWPLMSRGALAFGSGMSASLQRFSPSSSGFGQPLEWYFQPNLLGFVLRDEMPLLEGIDGFHACGCPYCDTLEFEGSAAWNREAAALHYLWWCARLASQTNITQMRQRLGNAESLWEEIQRSSVVLDRRSEPRHLGAWSRAVAPETLP